MKVENTVRSLDPSSSRNAAAVIQPTPRLLDASASKPAAERLRAASAPKPDLVPPQVPGSQKADMQPFLKPIEKDMHEMRYLMMDATATRATDVGTTDGAHATLAADAWHAAVGQAVDLGGNRGGMSLTTTLFDGNSFGVYQNIRFAGADFVTPVGSVAGDPLDFRGDPFGGPNWGALSGTMIWHGKNGAWGGVGAAVWLEATTGIRVLGQYEGEHPDLQGKYLVEWSEKLGPGVALDIAMGQHLFGVAGKAFYNGNRSVHFRTFMTKEEVRGLLNRPARGLHMLRNAATATKLITSPVKVPTKKEAAGLVGFKTLRPGEALRVTLGGTFILGVSVGSYGLRGGIHATYAGESEYVIGCIDENHLELRVKPKSFKALTFTIDSLVLAEAYHIRSLVLALEQRFRIDTRKSSARAWLDKALGGNLVGAGGRPSRAESSDLKTLRQKFGHDLPQGVSRTFIAKDDMPSRRTGAGIPRPFFTRKIVGFGWDTKAFCDRHLRSVGNAALRTRHCGGEDEKQKTYWGSHRVRISSETLQRITFTDGGEEAETFAGLVLQADFDFDRLRGKSGLNNMAMAINQAMGTDLGRYRHPGGGLDHQVALRRTLTGNDLRLLAQARPGAVAAYASPSGADPADLRGLVSKLAATLESGLKEDEALNMALATPVQKYIGSHGLAGFGALHRLVGGGSEALEVVADRSATDKAVNAFGNLILRFPDAITPNTSVAKQAGKAFAKIESKVERAITAHNDNQVLRWFDERAFLARLSSLLKMRSQIREHRISIFGQSLKPRQKATPTPSRG